MIAYAARHLVEKDATGASVGLSHGYLHKKATRRKSPANKAATIKAPSKSESLSLSSMFVLYLTNALTVLVNGPEPLLEVSTFTLWQKGIAYWKINSPSLFGPPPLVKSVATESAVFGAESSEK